MSTKNKSINPTKVDLLGEIKLMLKKLKKDEAELIKELKPLMEDGEVFQTNDFTATIIVRNNRILDQEAIRKRIGQKKYLELAKIGVEDLKAVMGVDEIDECTLDMKQVRSLEVEPRAKEVGGIQFTEDVSSFSINGQINN